jgi:hypothetical protein
MGWAGTFALRSSRRGRFLFCCCFSACGGPSSIKNIGTGGCICWNSRFSKDYFNRSFAPENQNYSVAVIDSSGNLILRVGKYGNIEDGKPLIMEGGPKEPQSIGGDEVGLFYACYVASHTDKRLFIADAGNTRILSVKLGYHSEAKINIKEIK